MKLRYLALAFALVASFVSGGQEQFPGQGEHAKPPEGWACDHNAKDDAHKCSCVRKCVPDTDEDGNPLRTQHVQEDQKCGAYCHPEHCHCEVKCGQT